MGKTHTNRFMHVGDGNGNICERELEKSRTVKEYYVINILCGSLLWQFCRLHVCSCCKRPLKRVFSRSRSLQLSVVARTSQLVVFYLCFSNPKTNETRKETKVQLMKLYWVSRLYARLMGIYVYWKGATNARKMKINENRLLASSENANIKCTLICEKGRWRFFAIILVEFALHVIGKQTSLALVTGHSH